MRGIMRQAVSIDDESKKVSNMRYTVSTENFAMWLIVLASTDNEIKVFRLGFRAGIIKPNRFSSRILFDGALASSLSGSSDHPATETQRGLGRLSSTHRGARQVARS